MPDYAKINKFIAGLPIYDFYDRIMASDARYIIVEAETGSGKTVGVPQWFLQDGKSVIVTEPLIETVIGTTEFVAGLMDEPVGGDVIGYATGDYKKFSSDTRLLYCTDGLALVRELNTGNRFDILVIDELHVWNTNQSTLEAWAWKHVLDGTSPFKKVVVLSATLDSESLSKKRNNAPIFKVPGRTHEIEDRRPSRTVVDDVISLVADGCDVLVFQPGKREIERTIDALAQAEVDAELIPFHGQLDRSDKNRAYRDYSRPKVIVSTNSLETGRTVLPSKVNGEYRTLAVVDSGMERRIEIESGIETLVLRGISKANSSQRRGRTGRVGKGIYIDHCADHNRTAYPVPEIQRTLLDQTVLRLAVAGYDATELPFFHDIKQEVLEDAKATLVALGFLKDGKVTRDGFTASKLPVGVKIARMVLEAANRGVVDDVLTIAAIMETGSLKKRAPKGEQPKWKFTTEERESDLLAELDLYTQAGELDKAYWNDAGIFAGNYYKAKQLRSKLRQTLYRLVKMENGGSREEILKSVAAGMVDHLYQEVGYTRYGYQYSNGDDVRRQIDNDSVVPDGTEWVVGMPFDLEIKTRRGGMMTLNLITWVTKVDPSWLVEVVPQLSRTERRNYRFDSGLMAVVCDEVKVFNGQDIATETVEGKGQEAVKALAKSFAGAGNPFSDRAEHPDLGYNKQVRVALEDLNKHWPGIGKITDEQMVDFYIGRLGDIYQVEEAGQIDLKLTDADVSQMLGVDYPCKRARILAIRPDNWTIKNTSYPLTYSWSSGWGFKGVEIRLSRWVIADLREDQMPRWRNMQVRVQVEESGYSNLYVDLPNGSLDDLRAKIEQTRKSLAWNAFKNQHNQGDYDIKIEVAYGESLPDYVGSRVWDWADYSRAYPALVFYTAESGDEAKTVWYLRWFQSKEEALKAREVAAERKAQEDAQENERRNWDELVAKAKASADEALALMDQINWNNYEPYGLTSSEASSWNGLRSQLNDAKNIQASPASQYGYSRGMSPTDAIAKLDELKARVEQALAEFAKNEEIRLAEEAAKREAEEALEKLVADRYATCPACGVDLEEGFSHNCDGQDALRARGQYEDFVLRSTTQEGETIVEIVAKYDDRYNEYDLHLKVNRKVSFDPESAETKSFWREPSKRELEIASQITKLKEQLREYDWQREARNPRYEVTFSEGKHRGKIQYSGESIVDGESVMFLVNYHDMDAVQPGQTWLVTEGREIGKTDDKPIILANLQLNIDDEPALREELAKLETELAELDSDEEEPQSGETETGLKIITSEVPNAVEQAMINAGLAVHMPGS